MKNYISVFCTVPGKDIGLKIANHLVNEGIAACVNILPGITSVYKWKGEICTDNEFLLIIKSTEGQFDSIKREVTELHPYEVPEIISFLIKDGHEPYLEWIDECLKIR